MNSQAWREVRAPARFVGAGSAAALILVVAGGSSAVAGGFYSPYQSATGLATAFAGASARSDDAGFFLYNPATISGLDGTQSYIDVRGFAPSAEITPRRALSPTGTDITTDGASGDIAGEAIAPGSVTAFKLTKDLTLGWGSSAPFATDVKADPEWGGRFHLVKSRMVSMAVTAAASYEIAPGIAVSAGVTGDLFDTRFENVSLLPIPGGAPVEALTFMKGKDWGFGGVLGVVMTPVPGTRIGAAYHSKIAHSIDGFVDARFPGIPSERTRYDVDLPQRASLGLEQRVDNRLRLFAELQWVDWSTFDGFDISFASGRPNSLNPVEWRDTWMVAGGLAYEVNPGTEISAGIHYDMAASQSGSGVTLSADASKIMAGIGISQDVAGFGRVTVSYAHVFALDAPVVAISPTAGTLDGTLEAEVDMIGIGLKHVW